MRIGFPVIDFNCTCKPVFSYQYPCNLNVMFLTRYTTTTTESKLTYQNNEVGYALFNYSKCTLVIARACWELQNAWAIKGSTLSCTEMLKSSII